MPKPGARKFKRLGVDTETTGLDLRHGAKPFLVTTATEAGNTFWEWDVDPITREPQVVVSDLYEIEEEIKSADELVLQHSKFDVAALDTLNGTGAVPEENLIGWMWEEWPWEKVFDTLMAAHILASNKPKGLDALTIMYLMYDIDPFDKAVEDAVKAAKRIVENHYKDWRLAKAFDAENEDTADMPSAEKKVWKFDMWLPRALVKADAFDLHKRKSILPSHPQQPTVSSFKSNLLPEITAGNGNKVVRIDRQTKWGNPFEIGKHGTREQVVRKYAEYIWKSDLMADLPELYGKVLACHCSPLLCHGDVLRSLCHPWRTVTSTYANVDSSVLLPLRERMYRKICERKLDKIFAHRMKLVPVAYQMECNGVTVNQERLLLKKAEYQEESERLNESCVAIAKGYQWDLTLPKSGNNHSLKHFVFGEPCKECNGEGLIEVVSEGATWWKPCETCYSTGIGRKNLNLPILKTSKKTGEPSFDKKVIEQYVATLPYHNRQWKFVKNISDKRSRDTAIQYMTSYERYWVPVYIVNAKTGAGWYRLHSSLNPTGTDTLRWSSNNPNEQNVSKKKGFNLRYCFGPRPGREWWSLDAQNIELRIPAFEAPEPEMVSLFLDPNSPPYFGSYHMLIFDTLHPDKFRQYGMDCKEVFESTWYQWTKNGNFAVQYGAQEYSGTADAAYHIPGAQSIIMSRFTNIKRLSDGYLDYANKYGYVETLPDKTVDPERGYPLLCTRTEYGGILPTVPLSYHTQGTAMQWMGKAMIRCDEYLKNDNRGKSEKDLAIMTLQVHDELVFDFPRRENPKKSGADRYTNLPKVRELQALMAQGGDDIGIPTTVSCKLHLDSWDEGIKV